MADTRFGGGITFSEKNGSFRAKARKTGALGRFPDPDCSNLTQDCSNLTQDSSNLTQDCPNLTQGRPDLTQDCPRLTQGSSSLTQDRPDLTQGSSDTTQGRKESSQIRGEKSVAVAGERGHKGGTETLTRTQAWHATILRVFFTTAACCTIRGPRRK